MVTRTSRDLGALLFGKTRGALLELLLTRPDQEFHLRQIVRLSHTGLGPAQRDLKLLADCGIIKRRQVGLQVFYRADMQSPIYNELHGIILKTVGAASVIAAAIQSLAPQIQIAFIFGSFARKQEQAASDVDVMIIGHVPFDAAAKTLAKTQHRLGREVNPSVYRPEEFAAKFHIGHPFISAVMAGEKIFLIGDEHELSRMV